MRIAKTIITTIILSLSLTAQAEVKMHGLPIKIGDTVEEVQKALGTRMEPEPYQSPGTQTAVKKLQLRLKTKGVWVIFEKEKATTIRMDAPFAGNIEGVKLGDSERKIEKTFGKAVKQGNLGSSTTYQYYFNDVTTTEFVVNNSGALETIFLLK
ncbi:hypothetical protein OL229_15110 [Neisseriaceae bacterium JH1-16]|nr:hypothetical protein [Neisseriaceae bacterium JH1-16]